MKAGVITFHRADNYGALLQVYGLLKVLNKKGIDAEIIDYRCSLIEREYRYRLFPGVTRDILWWLKRFSYNISSKKDYNLHRRKCDGFRNRYLRMGSPVFSEEDRKLAEKEYQLIVTGSDQIWSFRITRGKDDWYAFKRTGRTSTIVSYGASVGSLKAFDEHFKLYEEDLTGYDLISAREKETRDYLQDKLQRDIAWVLDPTLLLSAEEWVPLAAQTNLTKRRYVLNYDADYNDISFSLARKIAEEYGLDLIHFNQIVTGKHYIHGQSSGPEEFLGLIKDAEYVVTSSFHATVFSILFHKKFVVVPHRRTGARVRSLLEDVGMQDRICESYSDFSMEKMKAEIDYGKAFERLEKRKKESVAFLDECIETAKRKSEEESDE